MSRERLREHVAGHVALQHFVALVEQLRKRALGDGDERQLVGDLEQRERALARGRNERGRQALVAEARAEAEARDTVIGEALDQLALRLRAIELHPGGEQQLAAAQPRRGVEQLGRVHPAHMRLRGVLSAHQLETELGY